jgi:SAM-dependent methyltransferase
LSTAPGKESDSRFTDQQLSGIVVCPACRAALPLVTERSAECEACGESYRWIPGTWDLVPSFYSTSSPLWSAWERVQGNGLVSYTEAPTANLAVGEREDCAQFSQFCRFDGLVLDVGCGLQEWPAYFRFRSERTRFVGVDALIQRSSARYTQLRALAEYLPFRAGAFDQVVFATSLDHFVDPTRALVDARRVCRADGEILLWVGEKRPGAPRPPTSPEWYLRLVKPEEAEDVFHLKRLAAADAKLMCERAGLKLAEERTLKVDEFRSNHFLRLKIGDDRAVA